MTKLQEAIKTQQILKCSNEDCKGPVKPNIVFFGEQLPKEFFKAIDPNNLLQVDLLIVMGTALAVTPFNMIPKMVG